MKSMIQKYHKLKFKIMSKHKIVIVFMLILSYNANSQSCDNFNKATFQHTTNFWNWTDFTTNNWVAYYKNSTGATPINPPFKSVPAGIAQSNVDFLYPAGLPSDKIDMYPQDGWELIIRNFGINSTNPSDRVSNPGFVLYNRFRSMLRFFIYASPNPSTNSNSAMMKVTMPSSGTNKIPAYFNNITSIAKALDTITKDIPKTSNPNLYFKWENNWLIIDMPVAYDPCVCTQPYDNSQNSHKMQYEYAEVSSTSTVGNITEKKPTADEIIKNGDYVHYTNDPNTHPLMAGFGELVSFTNQVMNAGNAGKKQFDGFSTQFQSAANDAFDFIKPILRDDNLPKDIVWPQAFKTLFDAVPYAGMAFGLYNFIANGGNRSFDYSKYYAGFATPREYTFTSSATTSLPSTPYNFYTPGSQFDRATANHGEKPIYDYVLGTFQLLETPELEVCSYMDSANGGLNNPNINQHVADNAFSPRLLQYRLKNPIKYAINPASELVVKSLDVALEYKLLRNTGFFRYIDTFQTARSKVVNIGSGNIEDFYHPMLGPVFLKQSNDPLYSKRLSKSGVFIANWPTKWTDTAKDIYQGSTASPIISKGYSKEHLFNATFATQWFNPILHKEYSFLIGDVFWKRSPSNKITSGLNVYNFANTAGTAGLHFTPYASGLDVKLKVRVILRRTDADATSSTEDIVVVQTFDVKKPSISNTDVQLTQKSYLFNSYLSSWTGARRPGKDFYIQSLNGGNPVFPINDYVTYPDTIWINTPYTATKDTVIFATSAIFVNSIINTTNFKVEFRAPNGVYYGSGHTPNVTGTGSISDNISGKRPGSELILQPSNWSDVLNSHCKNKAKYDPIYTKSAIIQNSNKPLEKITFTTTATLFPNPTNSNTTLELTNYEKSTVQIRVYDMIGREVWSQVETDIKTASHKVEVESSKFQTGIYIVNIDNGMEKKSMKLEVKK